MKKRSQLEQEFNAVLNPNEFLVRFVGDHEIIITGAPKNNFVSRIFVSFIGVLIVTVCLILGNDSNTTFIIGGSLLGLVIAGSPFISFYSKKHFEIHISRSVKKIKIYESIISPYQRIDFSAITDFTLDRVEADDFASGEKNRPMSYHYTFTIHTESKKVDLFSLSAHDKSLEKFANKFSEHLSNFIQTDLKSSFHQETLPIV